LSSLAIAVVVPVAAGEAPPSEAFFERVRGAVPPAALFAAADVRTPPETREAFERAGAILLTFEEAPRGARLTRAALSPALRGFPLLLFLHSDTLLPDGWAERVRAAVASGAAGGAFRLAFEGGGSSLSCVAFWANLRTALTRVPYGDQAPFVRRDVYERLGGHRPWPLLEDVDLFDRVKRAGRVVLLPLAVRTSPRRYLERGILRTVLLNWKTLLRYRMGVDPEILAREYRS
jgi:hypothetical protein